MRLEHGQTSPASADSLVDVGGYRLQFHVTPGTSPTILFESGGGDDSSVWTEFAAALHAKTGARTVTYDRAGFGKSELPSSPYDIDSEVEALERGLRMLQINDDLVLVPHSYGGFLATLFAARNPRRVGGAVLVDIDHIGFYNDGRPGGPPSTVIERARQEQRLGAVRYLEGRRGTVARMRTVEFPSELRTIDIVSESTPRTSPEDKASWNRAHEEFVKGSPNRKLIVATGSGHYVMRDKPDVVIEAIEEVYAYARTTGNVR